MSKRIKKSRPYQFLALVLVLVFGHALTEKKDDSGKDFITAVSSSFISTARADHSSGGDGGNGSGGSDSGGNDSGGSDCGSDCSGCGDSGGASAGSGESY